MLTHVVNPHFKLAIWLRLFESPVCEDYIMWKFPFSHIYQGENIMSMFPFYIVLKIMVGRSQLFFNWWRLLFFSIPVILFFSDLSFYLEDPQKSAEMGQVGVFVIDSTRYWWLLTFWLYAIFFRKSSTIVFCLRSWFIHARGPSSLNPDAISGWRPHRCRQQIYQRQRYTTCFIQKLQIQDFAHTQKSSKGFPFNFHKRELHYNLFDVVTLWESFKNCQKEKKIWLLGCICSKQKWKRTFHICNIIADKNKDFYRKTN